MKKLKLCLLAGVLLLSSCNVPALPEQQSLPVFKIQGDLPEIGQFSGKEHYSRFFSEYTTDFIPSDEYGKVIPFIGSTKEYYTPKMEQEEYSYTASSKYNAFGFCTPDGKIVMDANDNINYVGHTVTDDGFGYYTYSVMPEENENSILDDVYLGQTTYFLPESGKWILELSRGSWAGVAGNGVITVMWVSEDNDELYPSPDCLRLYDYDGVLLSEIKGEDSSGAEAKSSCGMLLVREYKDGQNSARFIDINGETVLGPYESANSFMGKGIATVKEYGDGWYFIDTNGIHINEESYDSIGQIFDESDIVGYRAFRDESVNVSDIYDLDANLMSTIKSPGRYCSVHITDDGDIYSSYYDDGEVFVDAEGNRIVSSEFGVEANRYSPTPNLLVHRNEEDASGVIFDYDGNTVAVLDSIEYLNSVSGDGRFICYSSGNVDYNWNELTQENTITDTSKTHIYDAKEKKEILSFNGSGNCTFAGKNDRYIIITIYDATEMFGDSSKHYMYDTVKGKMLFEDCLNIMSYYIGEKYYYLVSTANKCTLYDENLKVILITINE